MPKPGRSIRKTAKKQAYKLLPLSEKTADFFMRFHLKISDNMIELLCENMFRRNVL